MYITNMLGALEQVTELLLASISTSVKWEHIVDTQEMLGSLVFTFSPPHIPLRAAHLCLTITKDQRRTHWETAPSLRAPGQGVSQRPLCNWHCHQAQRSGRGAAAGVLTFKGTHRIWSSRPWQKVAGEADVFI